MVDDTLSQVGFKRVVIKCAVSNPAERHAMAKVSVEGEDPSDAHTVRRLIDAGLTALGWPPERRIEEYANHAVACLKTGTPNEFEKARS